MRPTKSQIPETPNTTQQNNKQRNTHCSYMSSLHKIEDEIPIQDRLQRSFRNSTSGI
jgi:hypothetical protein